LPGCGSPSIEGALHLAAWSGEAFHAEDADGTVADDERFAAGKVFPYQRQFGTANRTPFLSVSKPIANRTAQYLDRGAAA
jgi:hypothetical protein